MFICFFNYDRTFLAAAVASSAFWLHMKLVVHVRFFAGVMTPSLMPVGPGLWPLLEDLTWVCHCPCHQLHTTVSSTFSNSFFLQTNEHSNIVSRTVYSAPPASFSNLSWRLLWPTPTSGSVLLFVQLVCHCLPSLAAEKNIIQLGGWPLGDDLRKCETFASVGHVSSLKSSTTVGWKASVHTPVFFFFETSCRVLQIWHRDLPQPSFCQAELFVFPRPWVVFLCFLSCVPLLFPTSTFLLCSLHWA